MSVEVNNEAKTAQKGESAGSKKPEHPVPAKVQKVNAKKFIKRNRPKSSYGLYSKTITGQLSNEILATLNENKAGDYTVKRTAKKE